MLLSTTHSVPLCQKWLQVEHGRKLRPPSDTYASKTIRRMTFRTVTLFAEKYLFERLSIVKAKVMSLFRMEAFRVPSVGPTILNRTVTLKIGN